jgi:hypothetical protein
MHKIFILDPLCLPPKKSFLNLYPPPRFSARLVYVQPAFSNTVQKRKSDYNFEVNITRPENLMVYVDGLKSGKLHDNENFCLLFQCKNGHLLCQVCNSKLTQCPCCRETLTNIRCWTAENILEKFPLKCHFASDGCDARLG